VFSALERAMVIEVACELPSQRQLPFSRHSAASIQEAAVGEGIMVSVRTVQRILAEDTLKPWHYRSWIHPRHPDFRAKAAVILDLYQGVWQARRLGPADLVVCADEKSGIQVGRHQIEPTRPGRLGRVESDYQRCGALQYLGAWDVQRGLPWGRCEPKNGIAAFDRLVEQVMTQDPYRSAARVFWIVDNGSSHGGRKAVDRLKEQYPNFILVHTPVHASWLNQQEIYFGLVQRKVLTPAAAHDLAQLEHRILAFEAHSRARARPFAWRFTRADFERRLHELAAGPLRNFCRGPLSLARGDESPIGPGHTEGGQRQVRCGRSSASVSPG
jgi:hypothetical protein